MCLGSYSINTGGAGEMFLAILQAAGRYLRVLA